MLIAIGFVITVASVFMHFQKTFDFQFQHFFRANELWMVSSDQTIWHKIFYTGPKDFAIFLGVGLLTYLIYRRIKDGRWNYPAGQAVLLAAALPLIIGGLKSITGQPCPNDFLSFGGSMPDDLLYRAGSKCFPGAHASTGLALLAVSFFIRDRAKRNLFATIVFIWSWAIATYQVARGMHFMSDSFATFGLAFMYYGAAEKRITEYYETLKNHS